MPYSKVLVPAGGNKNFIERSLKALDHAIPLCSGEIMLLNITEPLPGTVGGEAREQLMRKGRAAAEEALRPLVNAIAEKAKPAGLSWRTAQSPIPSSALRTSGRPISSSCSPMDATTSAAC